MIFNLPKDFLTIPLKSISKRHIISDVRKGSIFQNQRHSKLNQASGYRRRYTVYRMSSKLVAAKPPNIVIYGCERASYQIQAALERYLDRDRYVFLDLSECQLISEPWTDNTEVIIVTGDVLPDVVQRHLLAYWRNSGKVLSFGTNLLSKCPVNTIPCPDDHLQVCHELFGEAELRLLGRLCEAESFLGKKIAVNSKRQAVVIGALQDENTEGILVFSQVSLLDEDVGENGETVSWKRKLLLEILRDVLRLECTSESEGEPPSSVPLETPCYLYGKTQASLDWFVDALRSTLQEDVLVGLHNSYQLVESLETLPVRRRTSTDLGQKEVVSEDLIPVLRHSTGVSSCHSFLPGEYFSHLSAEVLGKIVWYGQVMSTTMDIFHRASIPQGVVCIAGRQTKGKGRGNHSWLSPVGCAMFSLQVSIAISSRLGRHLTFVQHLASLAIVEGVKTIPGYENVNLKLKWPNDVYFGDPLVKLGGVIVQSTMMASTALCTIGCGLNVDNAKPTICFNDVIKAVNPELPKLSHEIVIARSINKLEELIDSFQQNGAADILPRYYSHWLHGGLRISLTTGNGKVEPASIQGLDDYGFLRVKLQDTDRVLSVQPDGNSFDALHNLLIIRSGSDS